MITITRYKRTAKGFAVVVTDSNANFRAYVQEYTAYENGCTTLEKEQGFINDKDTDGIFNRIGEML